MANNINFNINDTNLSMRIGQAEFYLREFENELQRANGATGVFRSKDEALSRVKLLHEFAPQDPRVQALFDRAKKCIVGSTGNFIEITDEMTVYLRNEENLRSMYADKSVEAWERALAQAQDKLIEKVFPAPDILQDSADDYIGKCVVLDEVRYPANQFMGVTGEYIYVGKRSTGMYFVKIDSRKWLGPYEAVKRYRRLVNTTMNEVEKWVVLGEITEITMEVPEAGESKVGGPVYAFVVEPSALYVPGHVMASYDAEHETGGAFVGESELAAVKESWYSEKTVPEDVSPERLVEIFRQAIKEKNYELYRECIQEERRHNPVQESLLLYHWDLHQERFHGEYVHANVVPEETKITVIKGYSDESGLDSYFLSNEEQQEIASRYGEKIEYASVQTVAFDRDGKQLGSPVKRNLIRKNGGRWYVREYEQRF